MASGQFLVVSNWIPIVRIPPPSYARILIASVALAATLGLPRQTWNQEARTLGGSVSDQNPPAWRGAVPGDWSHHHLVFSPPGTVEEAVRNGKLELWQTITNEPRYRMQLQKRTGWGPPIPAERQPVREETGAGCAPDRPPEETLPDPETLVSEEDFPGGILPRGLARALITPPVERGAPPGGSHPGSPCRQAGKQSNRFQKDWSETEGNNGTTGMGVYPATFTSTGASCAADFAVYNTGLAGSSSQASIIAYNQLYSGCSPRPSAFWAYNTGGTIATSIVLSLDGTQAAFVQSNSSGVASLVALKWVSGGTLTNPTTLSSNGSFPNCTAPCMISLTLSGNPGDTYSSPFPAYGFGGNPTTVYVGDDAGKVHKFVNFFSASTPAEVTSTWPVTVNTSTDAALSSPVYDSISGNIYVGDYLGNISSNCQPGISSAAGQCGYLYSINASSGAVVQSAQLDYNLGLYDGPLVDSTAGKVYAFVGADNSSNCSSGPCAAVFQFPVGFTSGASGTEATVGAGYELLMAGMFDNQYFTSTNPSSPTGHLYVVGGTGPQNNTLYAITITNNVMTTGSATAGPVIAANYTNGYYAGGLPLTEFCNNGNNPCTASQGIDYLFLGVLSFGNNFSTNPCPSQSLSVGCMMGFTLPASGVVSSSATPNGTLQEAGGTSGIVVDNGAAGASNIYFSTLLNQTCTTSGGTAGCAVSATQSALQ